MEANSNNNRIDSLITSPLLDNGIPNEQSSDTFIRRSTFIPTPKDAGSLDENSLTAMGFDGGMVKKVYLFLKPRNINEAIEMMSEVDGIYQHDFYEGRATSNINLCYICKRERRFHRDYVEEEKRVPVEKPPFLHPNFTNIMDSISISFESNDNDNNNSGSPISDDYDSVGHSPRLNDNEYHEETKECLICLETFNLNEGNRLPCGHFCCKECLFNYLKTEIESAKVAKLQCFIRDCDYVLNEDFILSQLRGNKILIDKYKVFKQRAEIFLSKDKKFCPEPDCNSYLKKGKDKYVQCENGHQYCYICLKPWHGKSKCDEELDKDFQNWSKNKVVKKCPRCKIYTEKNEG